PEELNDGKLDLVVAGTKDGIMMVEAGANEVTEEEIVKAMEFAFKNFQPAIKLQEQLVKKVGVEAIEYELVLPDDDIKQRVETWVAGKMGNNLRAEYPERNQLVQNLREAMHAHFAEDIGEEVYDEQRDEFDEAFTMAV